MKKLIGLCLLALACALPVAKAQFDGPPSCWLFPPCLGVSK